MKFKFDDYSNCHVMHCKTEEESDFFTEFLASIGKAWRNGESYIANNSIYEVYGEGTCYIFREGVYGNLEDLKEHDTFVILEFSDFDWDGVLELETDEEDESALDDFFSSMLG